MGIKEQLLIAILNWINYDAVLRNSFFINIYFIFPLFTM